MINVRFIFSRCGGNDTIEKRRKRCFSLSLRLIENSLRQYSHQKKFGGSIMNKAAIYHRPESEFAYLYAKKI